MEITQKEIDNWQEALRFCLQKGLISKEELQQPQTPQQKQQMAARAVIRMKKYQEAHKE